MIRGVGAYHPYTDICYNYANITLPKFQYGYSDFSDNTNCPAPTISNGYFTMKSMISLSGSYTYYLVGTK